MKQQLFDWMLSFALVLFLLSLAAWMDTPAFA